MSSAVKLLKLCPVGEGDKSVESKPRRGTQKGQAALKSELTSENLELILFRMKEFLLSYGMGE